jgi:protein SCO1/2
MPRRLAAAIAVLCGVIATAGIVRLMQPSHAVVYAGTPLDPPKAVDDFVLLDQHGREAHLLDPHAAVTFLFFGYTHCPDECPLALASLGRAYRSLSPVARERVRIAFVTVDPARDTTAVLGRYVAAFDPHIVALGGAHDELARVWASYGVLVKPDAHELIDHGGAIYAIDSTSHAVLVYPPNATPAELAGDAAKLAG